MSVSSVFLLFGIIKCTVSLALTGCGEWSTVCLADCQWWLHSEHPVHQDDDAAVISLQCFHIILCCEAKIE